MFELKINFKLIKLVFSCILMFYWKKKPCTSFQTKICFKEGKLMAKSLQFSTRNLLPKDPLKDPETLKISTREIGQSVVTTL